MPSPEVVVVAESPSLGSAVFELLAAEGFRTIQVTDLSDAPGLIHDEGEELPRVLVCAPANRRCRTAVRWASGRFAAVPLVVVGTRDPSLPESNRIHFVTLPLSPTVLVDLVRGLAGRSPQNHRIVS